MKYIIAILLVFTLLLSTGCDIELGHEDHDHDGDGIQDHAPEDHDDEHYEVKTEENDKDNHTGE